MKRVINEIDKYQRERERERDLARTRDATIVRNDRRGC